MNSAALAILGLTCIVLIPLGGYIVLDHNRYMREVRRPPRTYTLPLTPPPPPVRRGPVPPRVPAYILSMPNLNTEAYYQEADASARRALAAAAWRCD